MTSIKENLIFALESAEYNNKEITFGYINSDGFTMLATVVPEIMVFDDQIEISDTTDFHVNIPLNDSIDYDDENDGEYTIHTKHGEISIFAK